jgi:hypothetical protein
LDLGIGGMMQPGGETPIRNKVFDELSAIIDQDR